MTNRLDINKNDCETCHFKKLCLQFLNPRDWESIENTTAQLRYTKGEYILKQGSHPTHIVQLKEGIVKHSFQSSDGKSTILTIQKAPQMLGSVNLFGSDNQNMVSVVALDDCVACMIDLSNFERVLQKNSSFLQNYFKIITQQYRVSFYQYVNRSGKQVTGRIADILLYLSDEVFRDYCFTLPVTRKELSEFAAASHENVISILSKFHKEGILIMDGKKIILKDRERLQQISRLG